MILTLTDDDTRYTVECPDAYGIKLDHQGADCLIVPDPLHPNSPLWLFDEVLLEAARCGELGLRLVAEEPLRPVGRQRGFA
jgi:hypothetical protein